jgi:molybdate transport system substrate-binding protein
VSRRLLLLPLLLLLAGAGRTPESLTVGAAASLNGVIEEIASAYEKTGGGKVQFTFAGSNVLARQIINGAPIDLFVSADDRQMDVAEQAGAIQAGSRVNIVGNRLAVIAPPGRADYVKAHFAEAPPDIRRLALGDPEAVPAGVYARQYLEKTGLWKSYESRVVPTANVRAAAAAVANGAADAGIVYITDLEGQRGLDTLAFIVPATEGPAIVYPAAIVKASRRQAEAARFLEFLRSEAARALFTKRQFIPPAAK